MPAVVPMLIALVVIAALLGCILGLHFAELRGDERRHGPVPVCHRTSAFVELATGVVRSTEPGFGEFFTETLFNSVTYDGRKSRLHLMPEPV
jgi:hypothetical protein